MSNEIDLPQLPFPQAIEANSFEDNLAKNKAMLLDLLPPAMHDHIEQVLQFESEPLVKQLEVISYLELILRERVNEAVLAGMLAFADGADLDQFAAGVGLYRKIIQEANPDTNPPTVEILESDEDFRRRVQMHPEKFSVAGPKSAYIAHALDMDDVADANVVRPQGGTVEVYIKSHSNKGIANHALCLAVSEHLNADERRPLSDTVLVTAATPKKITIDYVTTFEDGPDKELVAKQQSDALAKLLHEHRGIAAELSYSKILGVLTSTGVKKVELLSPSDIVCLPNEFIYVTEITAKDAAP